MCFKKKYKSTVIYKAFFKDVFLKTEEAESEGKNDEKLNHIIPAYLLCQSICFSLKKTV